MPGRLFLETPIAEIASWAGCKTGGLSDQPRRNIAPGQKVIVCGPDRVFQHMRWGVIPVGRVNARGRPVLETIVNARSETVFGKSAFDGVGRAIVPCDGWYEWTGAARRKTAWRIRRRDGAPMAFAAISDEWAAPGGRVVSQVATITCEPNGDVRDIHHRMGVILTPEQFEIWLTGSEAEASEILVPLADGTLMVEEASDVDWNAA